MNAPSATKLARIAGEIDAIREGNHFPNRRHELRQAARMLRVMANETGDLPHVSLSSSALMLDEASIFTTPNLGDGYAD